MRIWALWAVQTVFPKDEAWFGLLQLLMVTALLATLAILAIPHILALRQKSRDATRTATAEPLQAALARCATRIKRIWALWAVQTVFPKDEAWFGLPQLLMVTVFLATLAMLAVPHVLSLRQKSRVVTIAAEASPARYTGSNLHVAGQGDVRTASDCGCA
jgi:Tfp pilus assembly protein FimT